ncbi:hypothetical protein EJB05_19938, partial [Eragrostis curvula]
MNCLKNSCSVLSRLIRRKAAVCAPPPPPAQAARPRCYNTLRVLRPPPPPPRAKAPARWYHQNTTPRRQDQVVTRPTRNGGGSYRQWSEDDWDRKLTAAVLLSGGTVIAIYFGNLEKAPFTNRSRFIILTTKYERKLGESMFTELKEKLESKILPPDDPQSVRVRRISSEIVQAVHRSLAGTNDDGEGAACGYGDISADLTIKNRDAEAHRGGDEAMANDELRNRVMTARATSLLDGWEVIVVKDNMINAMCGPGGKIVVYTGLLDEFKEDAEVATVLGHEVGHAIARHSAEKATTHLWLLIVKIAIYMSTDMSRRDMRDLSNMFDLFLSLPFSRRMEMEADHIGLMLLAAAGYDPRVAPGVYEKLGKVSGDSVLRNYLSTHPSSKKRSQNLSQEQIMNKALELYKEFSTGQGNEERSPVDSGI